MYPILAFVMCILLLAAPAAGAGDSFIISYWCGPPADREPDAAYAEVAECGFTHAMPPYSGVTPEQHRAILDACEKHGLKYIIGDGRVFADPASPDFSKQLDSVIADYSAHPALAGFYLIDEPNAVLFPRLAVINQYLLKKDPKHLPYINLFPNYANAAQLGNPTYAEHVKQFCETVKPKLLSYDHYTSMIGDPENPPHLASYFQNLETVRDAGLKYKIPTCYIMLSLPHGPYRNPNETDMRWQIWNSLAYGVKAILYFTYWTPTDPNWNFHNGILDGNGKRTEHFNQAKRINSELKILGPTLMKLTSTGVYHAGTVPDGCRTQIDRLPIRVTNGAEVVVGMFRHQDGSAWAMITNRLMRKPATVALSVDGSVKLLEELSAMTGVRVNLRPDASGAASFDLRPGEGKLFKLVR